MKNTSNRFRRRDFLLSSAGLAASIGVVSTAYPASLNDDDNINIIGPKEGYSMHIGTLVSMMTWMRMVVLSPVKGLTTEQLDYIHDENSNSIGSMLLHLAATERFYQIHTFEGKKWGDWPDQDRKRFDVAMRLGDGARKTIKGNNLQFYLDALEEVRANTLNQFKKRNDKWLLATDEEWGWGPTNNYCKWFHVCEHESNHNGQIKWIKSRIPGLKSNDN